MTSVAGSFQTDLPLDDALIACVDAIDGLGWHIESVEVHPVEAHRIVSYADTGSQDPPKLEVELSDSGQDTNVRISGTDTDADPLEQDELIGELDRVRAAIEASIQGAAGSSASLSEIKRSPRRRSRLRIADDRQAIATAEPSSLVDVPAPKAGARPERVAGVTRRRLGRLPVLALASASGVALVSVADALSRSGRSYGEPLFWLGLLVFFVPTVAYLASTAPRRGERVALLLQLGLAFYLVKVLRDPFAFTYNDELVHQPNVMQILHSQALFGSNPILQVSPLYPGLEAVTAALASTSGLSTFTAGLVVIGVARMILMLALFLLYEAVTGSSRVAGLAAALYAMNPHYLFFTSQFAYESLALPLALLAVFAVVRTRPPSGVARVRWGIVAVAAILAVVVTHHVTSYALVALLLAICLVPQPRLHVRPWRPWVFAATALAATTAWLVFVASRTLGYLSPLITRAITETFQTAAGESATRPLFSSPTGQVPPVWEHLVGIGSAVITAAVLPLGLLVLWRRYRYQPLAGYQPLAVVLGCASIAYVGTLALRLVPAAWETGARLSEFLFIGVALVLALAAIEALDRLPARALVPAGIWAVAGVVLMGGVIAGASTVQRLAQPYRVAAAGADIDSPGVAVARWAREVLGPGQPIAAQEADARLLLVYGREHVFTGTGPAFNDVLQTPKLYRWQFDLLREYGVRYVVVDARKASTNVSTGYFFPRPPIRPKDRFPDATVTKFQRAGARRIYKGGGIIVYDIRGMSRAATVP
jgi:hypothetical protein